MIPLKQYKFALALFVGLLLLLGTAPPTLAAPPPNDNFADATVIAAFPFNDVIDISEAAVEENEQFHCTSSSRSVWYKFTPTSDMVMWLDTAGSTFSDSNVTVYEAVGAGLDGLSFVNCLTWGGNSTISVRADVTYYLQASSIYSADGSLHLNLVQVPPPPNDNFADAISITTLPFSQDVDTTGATRELNEPSSSCGNVYGSVWYSFRATTRQSVSIFVEGWSEKQIAVYTGSTLTDLTQVTCGNWVRTLTFSVNTGTTYYIQMSNYDPVGTLIHFTLDVTPPPQANFYFYPPEPSIFDAVWFSDNSGDPGGIGIASCTWDLGDRTSATDCSVDHQYTKDGNYTVQDTVTTLDGRSSSITQIVSVKTHDVAITKFSRPSSARAGRTYKLIVGLSNKRYPEQVQVELLKSTPHGYEHVGTLSLWTPVRAGNRTTDFYFSYTFTPADAQVGKVTFKAIATILNGRDALPADNEFISFPTKVTPKAKNDPIVAAGTVVEDMSNYVTDTVSNPLGIDAEAPATTTPTLPSTDHLIFIPIVITAE